MTLLLEAHARVDLKTLHGDTPLILAAAQSNPNSVQALVVHKTDGVDAQNQDGDTALMAASRAGNLAASKLLIAAGASTSLRNTKRATAVDVARDRGFAALARTLEGKS